MASPIGPQNVVVAARVRPLDANEEAQGARCTVRMVSKNTIITDPHTGADKMFTFDHSFWSGVPQREVSSNSSSSSISSTSSSGGEYASQGIVYKVVGRSMLKHAFEGFNTCIFAYGQTGSGKTYTMMGSETDVGIIPRVCDDLFQRIGQSNNNTTYKVELTYFEIYNEKVRCLLNTSSKGQDLKVREHPVTGPYVEGLTKITVCNFEDVFRWMMIGNQQRTVAATKYNQHSSRSHTVFTLTLTQTKIDGENGYCTDLVSQINLVDLAGSERTGQISRDTDRDNELFKEGVNINKSLSTLGRVIHSLSSKRDVTGSDSSTDKQRNSTTSTTTLQHSTSSNDLDTLSTTSGSNAKRRPWIAYRDSVLTWLLKENLGGNSKTFMLALISPSSLNYDDTVNTLRYADRVKYIRNDATINEDSNARIIRELKQEISWLREQLIGGPNEGPSRLNEGGRENATSAFSSALVKQIDSKLVDDGNEALTPRSADRDKKRRNAEFLALRSSSRRQSASVIHSDWEQNVLRKSPEELSQLREKADMSDKMLNELNKSWEDRMKAAHHLYQEQIHQVRQLSQRSGTPNATPPLTPTAGGGQHNSYSQTVVHNTYGIAYNLPMIVSLNPHPVEGEMLAHLLPSGETYLGTDDPDPPPLPNGIVITIRLKDGLNLSNPHCIIDHRADGQVELIPLNGSLSYINGHLLTTTCILSHGCRILLGNNHLFLFVDTRKTTIVRNNLRAERDRILLENGNNPLSKAQIKQVGVPYVLDWEYASHEFAVQMNLLCTPANVRQIEQQLNTLVNDYNKVENGLVGYKKAFKEYQTCPSLLLLIPDNEFYRVLQRNSPNGTCQLTFQLRVGHNIIGGNKNPDIDVHGCDPDIPQIVHWDDKTETCYLVSSGNTAIPLFNGQRISSGKCQFQLVYGSSKYPYVPPENRVWASPSFTVSCPGELVDQQQSKYEPALFVEDIKHKLFDFQFQLLNYRDIISPMSLSEDALQDATAIAQLPRSEQALIARRNALKSDWILSNENIGPREILDHFDALTIELRTIGFELCDKICVLELDNKEDEEKPTNFQLPSKSKKNKETIDTPDNLKYDGASTDPNDTTDTDFNDSVISNNEKIASLNESNQRLQYIVQHMNQEYKEREVYTTQLMQHIKKLTYQNEVLQEELREVQTESTNNCQQLVGPSTKTSDQHIELLTTQCEASRKAIQQQKADIVQLKAELRNKQREIEQLQSIVLDFKKDCANEFHIPSLQPSPVPPAPNGSELILSTPSPSTIQQPHAGQSLLPLHPTSPTLSVMSTPSAIDLVQDSSMIDDMNNKYNMMQFIINHSNINQEGGNSIAVPDAAVIDQVQKNITNITEQHDALYQSYQHLITGPQDRSCLSGATTPSTYVDANSTSSDAPHASSILESQMHMSINHPSFVEEMGETNKHLIHTLEELFLQAAGTSNNNNHNTSTTSGDSYHSNSTNQSFVMDKVKLVLSNIMKEMHNKSEQLSHLERESKWKDELLGGLDIQKLLQQKQQHNTGTTRADSTHSSPQQHQAELSPSSSVGCSYLTQNLDGSDSPTTPTHLPPTSATNTPTAIATTGDNAVQSTTNAYFSRIGMPAITGVNSSNDASAINTHISATSSSIGGGIVGGGIRCSSPSHIPMSTVGLFHSTTETAQKSIPKTVSIQSSDGNIVFPTSSSSSNGQSTYQSTQIALNQQQSAATPMSNTNSETTKDMRHKMDVAIQSLKGEVITLTKSSLPVIEKLITSIGKIGAVDAFKKANNSIIKMLNDLAILPVPALDKSSDLNFQNVVIDAYDVVPVLSEWKANHRSIFIKLLRELVISYEMIPDFIKGGVITLEHVPKYHSILLKICKYCIHKQEQCRTDTPVGERGDASGGGATCSTSGVPGGVCGNGSATATATGGSAATSSSRRSSTGARRVSTSDKTRSTTPKDPTRSHSAEHHHGSSSGNNSSRSNSATTHVKDGYAHITSRVASYISPKHTSVAVGDSHQPASSRTISPRPTTHQTHSNSSSTGKRRGNSNTRAGPASAHQTTTGGVITSSSRRTPRASPASKRLSGSSPSPLVSATRGSSSGASKRVLRSSSGGKGK